MQVGNPIALTTTVGIAAMTRQELEQLSGAELSDIIPRRQAMLLQQQALIEQLLARVETLEDQIKRLTQPPRDASKTRKPARPDGNPLFTFLYRVDVSPDNNACERALRKSVVHRKLSGGFRSEWGAAAFATTATVIETAAKRGEDALCVRTRLLTPAAPPLASPSASAGRR